MPVECKVMIGIVALCICVNILLAADFYNLHREDAQYSSHDIPWD